MAISAPVQEASVQVRHPLEAVRKHIHRYVFLETAALVLLVVALWFWIGLICDYGLFWLTAYDWMLELNFLDSTGQGSFGIRLILFAAVVGFLIYLVVNKWVIRLFKEFSDAAVALVLERRFPKELGDRLITAVELADPKKAESYGFSGAMLQKTINEAAERVDGLPVANVFDWARLRGQWWNVLKLTAGMMVLVMVVCIGVQEANGKSISPVDYLWRFKDVASIWIERHVFFQNSYWLRNTHLEVVRFQDTDKHPGEMRVGRTDQRPDLVVRSVQWVFPDTSAPVGWRALKVADLAGLIGTDAVKKITIPENWPDWTIDLDDLQTRVPTGVLPATWQGKPAGEVAAELSKDANLQVNLKSAGALEAVKALMNWKEWTVDKLLLQAERPDIQRKLGDQAAAITALEAKLEETATDLSMRRRVRKLTLPQDISVVFSGSTTTSTSRGDPQADRKFAFNLADLKESVSFYARAEDFFTPPLKITLVPAPAIKELTMDKEEPAYLYHRLQGDQAPLKGKKQTFTGVKVSVTGEMTTLDVPLGTNLTMQAVVDRPLKDGIHLRPATQVREAGTIVPDNLVTRNADGLGFSVRFENIGKTMEFQFEFHDEDNVKGRRRIRIRPVDDQPPEILNFELAAMLRKPKFKPEISNSLTGGANEGYLITPDALLPFNGTVRDDIGLLKLSWLFEMQPILIEKATDKDPTRVILQGTPTIRRAGLIASALQYSPAQPTQAFLAPAYLNLMGRIIELDLKQKPADPERSAPLTDFAKQLLRLEEISLDQLPERLKEKPKARPHLREHLLKEAEFFNVREQFPDLKMRGPNDAIQYHLLKLGVGATDNNVETGPSTSRTRTPLLLLIVPETELLAQIGLEEEKLRDGLEKIVQKLKNAQTTIAAQLPTLRTGSMDSDYALVLLRVDEVRKNLLDGASSTRDIFVAYSRILREMEINRVKSEKVGDVRKKIVQPLELIVDPNLGGFTLTEDVVQRLFAGLEDEIGKAANKNFAKSFESATQANDQLLSLIDQLNQVLQAIDSGLDFNEILQRAIDLERVQRGVVEPLRQYHDQTLRDLLELLINPKN